MIEKVNSGNVLLGGRAVKPPAAYSSTGELVEKATEKPVQPQRKPWLVYHATKTKLPRKIKASNKMTPQARTRI